MQKIVDSNEAHGILSVLTHVFRFRVRRAKEIIGTVLREKLTGVTYHADNTSLWAKEIADLIKSRLKGVEK